MTRERAKELWPIIKAYGEGKDFQYRFSGTNEEWTSTKDDFMGETCDRLEYRIKPEPKMRPMTRGEVLYMVTNTPGMVVKHRGEDGMPANGLAFCFPIEDYEYAIIDESGEPVDGWHKFEKEVSE